MTEEKREQHKKVTRPFISKRKDGQVKDEKKDIKTDLQEYVLFLMKNNGHTDILEGVQAGEFYMKSKDGKQEKSIVLSPKKLTTINYNNQYWKGWIAHEDNMSPYPQDPLHNGEMYRKTTQKLAMNYHDANEIRFLEAKRKMWLYIIGGVALLIYILYIVGKNAGWFTGGDDVAVTKATAEVVKEAVKNGTGVVVG